MCQNVQLADTNLKNRLMQNYPHVMQGEELNITEAAAVTGTLNLSGAGIVDASGIEYFTGIRTLNITNNQLTTIPDISATTELVNFYANGNQLTSLPDMTDLIHLEDFQVMHNNLTALPDLRNSSKLRNLFCSDNKIAHWPALNSFPDLSILAIGENPLPDPIDFSICENLTELHIHKTGLDTIIGLDKLVNLTKLFAWGNKIKNFSALDSNTTLTTFVVLKNPLHDLPYLANKPDLYNVDVSSCHLTFEDLMPLLQMPNLTTFKYGFQKDFRMIDKNKRAETDFKISYPITSPDPGNVYVWVKDGEVIDSSGSPLFHFNPLKISDSGKYLLKVYNAGLPNLLLKSRLFELNVLPCLEFNISYVDIRKKECSTGYVIDLSSATISGGTIPFTYEISNSNFNEVFSDEIVEGLPAGKYEVRVVDSNGCTASDQMVLPRIERCDPVITPDGDGIADTYFIEETGTVAIYDVNRRLIRSLTAPAIWDATDQNGRLVDAGYYILIINNDTAINVTVIR
ncbi:MAG: leucine-rich repeat domain-containing protein [Cytophagaceae bacterium]